MVHPFRYLKDPAPHYKQATAAYVAFLAACVLTSCERQKDTLPASTTVSAILAGDWQAALDEGKEWSAADPSNPVPHYLLNIAHTYTGNRDQSRAEFSMAFGKNDNVVRIDKWTTALIADHPTNPYAHLLKGLVHEVAGRNPLAVQCYETALQHAPTFKLAYASLGNLYLSSGQLDKAEHAYKRMSEIDPSDASTHVHIGTVYIMKGDRSAAIAEFEKACEMDPNDLIAHYNLGNAYLEDGLTPRAKATFERVIQLDPKGEIGNDARAHVTRLSTQEPSPVAVEKPTIGASRLEQLAKSETRISTYKATLQQRPPFYAGPLPMDYEIGRVPGPMGSGGPFGSMIDVYHNFGPWRNEFFYHVKPELEITGLASAARAVEKGSGRVLAEAKLSQVIQGEGIEIEEFHYRSDGAVRFYCKSRIDFGGRFKNTETDVRGQKERDYFFVWSRQF